MSPTRTSSGGSSRLHGEASRFLRASVGSAVAVLLFAVSRIATPARHEAVMPTDAELESAGAIIAAQTTASAYSPISVIKALLFDEQRRGFIIRHRRAHVGGTRRSSRSRDRSARI